MSEKRRILIADDSDVVNTVLRTALESDGFEVDSAQNGPEAYRLGMENTYDVIVLDQLMPGMLGTEIIEQWHTAGMDTPVLILSAVDDDRTVVESFEVGAVDFVRKPFRMPELLARIRQRLPR